MARVTQRKVKRQSVSGRQAVVSQYGAREWYELPLWAQDWLVEYSGWVMLALAILLAPIAAIALVLGVHALPLEFIGIPSSDNSAGLAAAVLFVEFILVCLAVRPLLRHDLKGWYWLVAAAVVYLIHSLVLQHGISGATLLVLAAYLYWQVRDRYGHRKG